MKIGLAQVAPRSSPLESLAMAREMAARAATRAVSVLAFPEMFMASPEASSDLLPLAEPLDGPFVQDLGRTAREHGVHIVAGVWESIPGKDKVYNTLVVLDPSGQLFDRYRKVHLFDALNVAESEVMAPGEAEPPVFQVEGVAIGLAICYDLRFPELFRSLARRGAELIIVPSAWYSGPLKEDHWLTLLRARAIENTTYVAGVDLTGPRFCARSSVIDPFGVMTASAGESEELLVAEISRSRVGQIRAKVPTLQHLRPSLYQK